MFARWWKHPQITRLQARFSLRPRNPLLRAVAAVLGVALLLVLLVAGAMIGAAMLIGAGLLRVLRGSRRKPQATGHVIEGEYRSAQPGALPQPR